MSSIIHFLKSISIYFLRKLFDSFRGLWRLLSYIYEQLTNLIIYVEKHLLIKLIGIISAFGGMLAIPFCSSIMTSDAPYKIEADKNIGQKNTTSTDKKSFGTGEKIFQLPGFVMISDMYNYVGLIPRFVWNLVYHYDGKQRFIYGKGHAYSGKYSIDGLEGYNIYSKMKTFFYGIDNNKLYEWHAPVENGFMNSYSGTPLQDFSVNIIPRMILICIEYDINNERYRAVSFSVGILLIVQMCFSTIQDLYISIPRDQISIAQVQSQIT